MLPIPSTLYCFQQYFSKIISHLFLCFSLFIIMQWPVFRQNHIPFISVLLTTPCLQCNCQYFSKIIFHLFLCFQLLCVYNAVANTSAKSYSIYFCFRLLCVYNAVASTSAKSYAMYFCF